MNGMDDRTGGDGNDDRPCSAAHNRSLRLQPTARVQFSAGRGVTMIELLVVVIIIGILAAIVLPSYQNYLYKSRRSDAMTALATLQQAQERWRGNHTTYQDTLANLSGGSASLSPSGWYNMSIVSGSVGAGSYTARATADSGNKQGGDGSCGIFEIVLTGGAVTYKSYASGGSQNGSPDPCWVK